VNHTETAARLAELAPTMAELADAGDLYPYTPGSDWTARVTPYGLAAVALGLDDAPRGAGANDPAERAVLHIRPAYAVTDDGTPATNAADLRAWQYPADGRPWQRPAITPHPAALDVEGITQRHAVLTVNGRPYGDSMTLTEWRPGVVTLSGGYGDGLTDSARRKLAAVFGPILAELDTPEARHAIRTRRAVTHAASAVTDAQRKLSDALDTLTAAGLIGGTR
jgi:hypothetical protein